MKTLLQQHIILFLYLKLRRQPIEVYVGHKIFAAVVEQRAVETFGHGPRSQNVMHQQMRRS